jgi:SAM-dependent methyltransferase
LGGLEKGEAVNKAKSQSGLRGFARPRCELFPATRFRLSPAALLKKRCLPARLLVQVASLSGGFSMSVLRVFGRKKLQRAQALAWEQAQETAQVMASAQRNGWDEQSTIQTGNGWDGVHMAPKTSTTRHTRPLEVQSEWIGTRRYLANLPYALPKDAPEADRLNFQHYYFRRLFKGLYQAPLEKPLVYTILDTGCGTGRWACEMAQDFLHAQVVGLDIELPRAGTLIKPPNLTFAPGNVLERLPFADQSFDFVHQRLLAAAIPTTQWPAVISELARVTRPGGWIELIEAGDAYLNIGPALSQFLHWSRIIHNARGIDTSRVAYLDDLLLGAGLSRVEKCVLRVPLGLWGGRQGSSLAQNMLASFEGMRGLCCRNVPLHPEQFDATLAILPDEWNALRTEFAIFSVYGQKTTISQSQ